MTLPFHPYQEYNIKWNNIDILIKYTPQWSKFADVAHLEIVRLDDGQLPMTETGYKSHFTHRDNISEYGGAVEFVTAWLDEYAQKKQWKSYIISQQQLTLF